MFLSQAILILVVINATFGSNITSKRGVFDNGYGPADSFIGYGSFSSDGFAANALPSPPAFKPAVAFREHAPSSAEIAAAIQAAKEASSAVMEAQHRVQNAKNDVLHQQHVATQRQAQAALALQRTEAAAAVQQQEARSAATALVHSQQRLAQAKAEVAQLQKIASAKESHAAAIIQKSAAAAAIQIQKTDETARKISALQSSGAAALKQAAAGKDGSLSATSAAVAAANNADNGHGSHDQTAWYPATKFVHVQPWG